MKKTVTTMICDKCGASHDAAAYTSGNSWGQLNLSWTGDKGGRTYDGSAGGINIQGSAYLCEKCTDDFLAFIKPN